MFNFIPEKVYEKIKNDQEYIDIDKQINDYRLKATTLREMIESDFYVKQEDFHKDVVSRIKIIVNKHCPELMEYYDLISRPVSKNELLMKYNSTQNIELRLTLLTYIKDYEYATGTYLNCMKDFVNLYKANIGIRKNFSKYLHLSYFRYASILKAYELPIGHSFMSDFLRFFENIKSEVSVFSDNDNIIQYSFLTLSDVIKITMFRFEKDDKMVYDMISNNENWKYLLNEPFQYSESCYYKLKINDDIFDLLFSNRKNKLAFEQLKFNIVYINGMFSDIERLNKSLSFYDKEIHIHLAIILRKYLKIAKLVPRLGLEEMLTRLPESDKEYFVGLLELEKLPNSHSSEACSKFVKSVDNWIDGNSFTLEMIQEFNLGMEGAE